MLDPILERKEPEPEPESKPTEEVKPPGYPCLYCRGSTEVVNTYPAYETTQEPIKTVKRRRRKCSVCNRVFTTQEETIKRA